MARKSWTQRYHHIVAVVQVTDDVHEIVLFGGRGFHGGHISESTIVRLEGGHHASAENWKVTDIAGPTRLGTSERKQYKRELREKENEKAYKKAVDEQLSVPIHIGRLNFVGLPRSGKTTTMKRLIGEILNIIKAKYGKEEASTGVAERNQIIIKCISKSIGFTSQRKWSRKDLMGEIGVLNDLILQTVKDATSVHIESEKMKQAKVDLASTPILPEEVEAAETTSILSGELYAPALEEVAPHLPPRDVETRGDFDSLLSSYLEEDFDTVRYLLEDTIYLINTDTGGQTEFLDLMSRFLMGPALNLIISRLVDPLDHVYKIYATDENGVQSEKEDSVVTLEEVIFQALASIASLEASYNLNPIPVENNSAIKMPLCSSKAIFVGTFRDKVTQEEFEEIDELLQKKIKQTDFYHKDLVLYTSENQLIYSLDNLRGSQEEIDIFRKTIERIIKDNFQQVESPASWLMLSVNIRHKGKRTMTLHECEEMSLKLGITPENLPTALWFLHYRVGILLYYPEIPGFADLIICDIQVIFDATTQLVKKTFIFGKTGKRAAEEFKEKAQFTLADLRQATAKSSGDDLIPMEKLVVLLEFHKILAPLPQHGCQSENKVYFMPCVLRSTTPEGLQNVLQSPHVAPLVIRYKCGYVPLGIFSSLIIALVSENKWILIEDSPKRNKIEFRVGDDFDTITLISYPTFLKVMLHREPHPSRCTSSVCFDVRATITAALEKVHTDLKYHSTATFQYGFECLSHPRTDHMCVLESGDTLLCLENQKRREVIRMRNREHRVWFYKVEDEPEQDCGKLPIWETLLLQLSYFHSIRYFDPSTGAKKELRIVDEICASWDIIGGILGFKPGDIEAIRNPGSGKTPQQCLCEVITRWMQNASEMPCSQRYPNNWTGVCNLLKASQYSTIANHLKAAIETTRSDLHGNFDNGNSSVPTDEAKGPPESTKKQTKAHGTSELSSAAPVSEESLAQEQSSQLQEQVQLQEPMQQQKTKDPLSPANLTSWSVDNVCSWLISLDLGKYVDTFRDNEVDGECLLTLDDKHLKDDLGITALGHRRRILNRVDPLKK